MAFKPNIMLTWDEAVDVAKEIIISLADGERTGAAKRRIAVDRLALAIDDALQWGDGPLADLFESVDGVASKLMVRFIVQSAYDILKLDEKV